MATEQDKARKLLRDAIGDESSIKRELTQIPYPFGGVSETFSFSSQEPGTSRDERNMRSFDVQTGRLRGSQRAGLGQYGDGELVQTAIANKKIALIASVTREVNPYVWTSSTSKEFEASADQGAENCTDIIRDSFGSYYILGQWGRVRVLNPDGEETHTFDAAHYESAVTGNALNTATLAVDLFRNVFVATGHAAGATSELYSMIHCYEHKADDSYGLAWTINPNMFVLDMAIYGLDLFVWGVVDDGVSEATYKLLRYPEYVFDEPPSADTNSTYASSSLGGLGTDASAPTADDRHVGRMAVAESGTVYATMSRYNPDGELAHAGLFKLQPISPTASQAVWEETYSGNDPYIGSGDDAKHQGYGLGVLLGTTQDDGTQQIWTWGGRNDANPDGEIEQPRIRMFTETPGGELNWASSYNISMEAVPGTPTSGWNPGTVDALHVRGAVDEDGRAYIPHNVAADTASTQDGMALLVVSRDAGDSLISITLAKTSTELGFGNGFSAMLAVAVPILHPDYNGAVISHTDRVVSGGDPDNDGMFVIGTSLVSYATASPSSAALALREIRTIALVNGKMYRLNDGLAATVIKVEGGLTDALYEEDTMYVQAATGNGHIYMTDGLSYFDYNPKDNEVYTLPSTSFGEIPKRARLIEFWRNRLVLARSDNVPGTWHMSRSGDVHDWDQYPQTDDSAKAVSGTTSPPGLCPDTINAIVPYSNDLLWFGCDSSIWQMTGDPSVGEFDMITDEIGMSWGRPFCKDDMGALWFFGSKGGLYTWDGGLRDVASGRIRRRLRDIDLSSNYIQLVYNYADDGIHIFVIPFGDPIASPRDHYFYDKRSQSFHIDQFGSTTAKIQPTAGIVIDGDAGADRAILLGGGDGRVRRWGSGVAGIIPKSDINTPTENAAIDSYVLIGPIADVDDMSEAAMSELAMVLAPNFSGVHIEIFVTDTPDSLGEPAWRGEIHAGRNANQLVRVSGDSIYIRLRNSTVDEHWALEKATAILSYGGQIRSRT